MFRFLLLALLGVTLACGPSFADIAYSVPDGTAIREKPSATAKIVYRKKSYDGIYRAKVSKKIGNRVFKTSTDGAPVCKAGWCEICTTNAHCGYVPAKTLKKFSFTPSDDDCDVWIDDDC